MSFIMNYHVSLLIGCQIRSHYLLQPANSPLHPSIESAVKLELKPLPDTLNYVFQDLMRLTCDHSLSVVFIIPSQLSSDQDRQLVSVSFHHKHDIPWSLSKLKRINPSICMYQIHLQENANPIRDMQCKLNIVMQEVLQGEVLKLLDT